MVKIERSYMRLPISG